MSFNIMDGTGTGKSAKVDTNNRLYVNSEGKTAVEAATDKGDSYNLNTGVINLTSANETAVLYVKNTDPDRDIHVSALAVGLGPSTGGTGSIPKVTVTRNPTGGTLVDSNNDIDVNSNRNFSSSQTLTATTLKGAEGETLTGDTDHLIIFQTANGRLFATIDEVLGNGASIGVKIDPQPSNTSMDIYAALICHTEASG